MQKVSGGKNGLEQTEYMQVKKRIGKMSEKIYGYRHLTDKLLKTEISMHRSNVCFYLYGSDI